MRAAKERKRLARLAAEPALPDVSHVVTPARAAPLFVISIRCRDGAAERLRIYETPFGLSLSPTLAGRKIAAVLQHYRPI